MLEKQAISMVQSVQRGFVLQMFLLPRRPQACYKSEGPEQVYCRTALQNEGHSHGKGSGETRGLASQNRCLFLGTNRPQLPEIPPVSVTGQSIPVSMSAIWPIMCSSHIPQN